MVKKVFFLNAIMFTQTFLGSLNVQARFPKHEQIRYLGSQMLRESGVLQQQGWKIKLKPGQRAEWPLRMIVDKKVGKKGLIGYKADYTIDFDRIGENVLIIQIPPFHQGETFDCGFFTFVNSYILGMSNSYQEAIRKIRSRNTERKVNNLRYIFDFLVTSRFPLEGLSLEETALLNDLLDEKIFWGGKKIFLADLIAKLEKKVQEKAIGKIKNLGSKGKFREFIDPKNKKGGRQIKRTYRDLEVRPRKKIREVYKLSKKNVYKGVAKEAKKKAYRKVDKIFKERDEAEETFFISVEEFNKKGKCISAHLIAAKAEKFELPAREESILVFIIVDSSSHSMNSTYRFEYPVYRKVFKYLAGKFGFETYGKNVGKGKPVKRLEGVEIYSSGVSPRDKFVGLKASKEEKKAQKIEKERETRWKKRFGFVEEALRDSSSGSEQASPQDDREEEDFDSSSSTEIEMESAYFDSSSDTEAEDSSGEEDFSD